MTISKGDIVTIKPEWQDHGDATFTWVARNDEEKGRLDISALELSHLPIWPMQTVTTDMLRVEGPTAPTLTGRNALSRASAG